MWLGPYIVKRFLAKGAYELVDFDVVPLVQPRNGMYLKKILCLISSVVFTMYILSIGVLSVFAVCLFRFLHGFC